MIKFTIQIESTAPSITFIKNNRKDNIIMTNDNLNIILKIANKFDIKTELVTNNQNDYKNIINANPKSFGTTIIHDYDISKFKNTKLNNILFFVHDEKNLFLNLFSIYECTYGSINIQFKYLNEYDLDILELEMDKIVEFLKSERTLLIPQLTYFENNIKFGNDGYNYFISPDMKVWYHSNYYYNNDDNGYLCDFIDFDFLNEDFYIRTKPHIVCETCNTFYCERDIYYNKMYTSEFKVPSSLECKRTTFLEKFSKKLYKYIYNGNLNINENLDTCMVYNPNKNQDINKVATNVIKKSKSIKLEVNE